MSKRVESMPELHMVLKWLDSKKPASYRPFGHLHSIVEGLLDGAVFVNTGSELRCIVITNSSKSPRAIQKSISVFTTDLDELDQLLSTVESIDWSLEILFCAVPEDCDVILQKHAKDHGGSLAPRNLKTLVCSSSHRKRQPPDFISVRPLRGDEAELVTSTWKFSKESTLLYTRHIIINYPSVCAVDIRSNAVIAWVIIQYDGVIGMLHVLPEYRGQGLAQYIVQCLTDKLMSMGLSAFAFIAPDNEASLKVFEKSGFVLQDTGICFAEYTPKKI